MADADKNPAITAFFASQNLSDDARRECHDVAAQLLPGLPITPSPTQGGCSYTLLAGSAKVVQFRPAKFRLDLTTTSAACLIYGSLAPKTEYRGTLPNSKLLIYVLNRLQGTSYASLRPQHRDLTPTETALQLALVLSFIRTLALSYRNRSLLPSPSTSPTLYTGKVAPYLSQRISHLASSLPSRFRPRARKVEQNLHLLKHVPWALTHGDLSPPTNVLINPHTYEISGLIDWAEAEPLPLGTMLYGLEDLLGYQISTKFAYYTCAPMLRCLAWKQLISEIPELGRDKGAQEAVRLARDIGVLLWHGYAWDDGKLDRAVNDERDAEEVGYLEAFLAVEEGYGDAGAAGQQSFPAKL